MTCASWLPAQPFCPSHSCCCHNPWSLGKVKCGKDGKNKKNFRKDSSSCFKVMNSTLKFSCGEDVFRWRIRCGGCPQAGSWYLFPLPRVCLSACVASVSECIQLLQLRRVKGAGLHQSHERRRRRSSGPPDNRVGGGRGEKSLRRSEGLRFTISLKANREQQPGGSARMVKEGGGLFTSITASDLRQLQWMSLIWATHYAEHKILGRPVKYNSNMAHNFTVGVKHFKTTTTEQ